MSDTEQRHRTVHLEQQMSDAEALMWNVEKDPWLNPSGAMATILDQPIDFDGFRRRLAAAVAETPRLRERVQPGLGRLSPPSWVPDEDFELDHHVRHIALPAPGTVRQLMDLCTHLYEDPLDRTRPLWVFYVIDGLEDGRGALFSKLHHTIADGKTAIRLSERYMEFERETETPDEVDLDRIVREAAAAAAARAEDDGDEQEQGGNGAVDAAGSALGVAGDLLRRQLDLTRKVVGEVAGWGADVDRPVELGEKAVGQAKSIFDNLGFGEEERPGSPLWSERSRHRHLEELSIPLDGAKAAGNRLGGTINDVFVIGAVAGAIEYHAKRGVVLDELNVSFVISTRTRSTKGGNAFTPTPVRVPARQVPLPELFETIRQLIEDKKASISGGSSASLGSLARVANMLPTSVVTRMARDRAGTLDFATSNLRGAPRPIYVSGGEVLQNIIMGPVAGTAFNLTTMSYNGSLDMGLFCDPAAVEDPTGLRDCLADAYAQLLALGAD